MPLMKLALRTMVAELSGARILLSHASTRRVEELAQLGEVSDFEARNRFHLGACHRDARDSRGLCSRARAGARMRSLIGPTLLLVALLVSCRPSSDDGRVQSLSSAPSAASSAPPRQQNGVPATQNGHFAEPVTYRGGCSYGPKGDGGCFTLTLLPDGGGSHVRIDVPVPVRYQVEGNTLTLWEDGKKVEQLVSADGLLTFGMYRFAPE